MQIASPPVNVKIAGAALFVAGCVTVLFFARAYLKTRG
jgi:hypothetical protein